VQLCLKHNTHFKVIFCHLLLFCFSFQFKSWMSLNLVFNFLSLVFHTNSWAVISVLRYLYILQSDWIHQQFQDPKKLRVLTLCILFFFYFIFIGSNCLAFKLIMLPTEGTVTSSFLMDASEDSKRLFSIVCAAEFMLPVFVSCAAYFLLLYQNSGQRNRKVQDLPNIKSPSPTHENADTRLENKCLPRQVNVEIHVIQINQLEQNVLQVNNLNSGTNSPSHQTLGEIEITNRVDDGGRNACNDSSINGLNDLDRISRCSESRPANVFTISESSPCFSKNCDQMGFSTDSEPIPNLLKIRRSSNKELKSDNEVKIKCHDRV